MEIVISYAREDRAIVEELAGTLRAWGHDVWTDAGAHSGARWWDEIVARIQACDVLLAVTSPASLASHACTLERSYAMALGKVLLPVLVAPVNTQGLPTEFASIHFFDFTHRDVAAAGRLYQAVQQLPSPGPLPDPLPPPPPPPLSYLNAVVDQLDALVPDLDLQHRIVTALTGGLRSSDPEERATAIELLRRFLEHPQNMRDPAARAREALARALGHGPGDQAGPTPPQPVPRSGSRPSSRASAGSPSCWSGWGLGRRRDEPGSGRGGVDRLAACPRRPVEPGPAPGERHLRQPDGGGRRDHLVRYARSPGRGLHHPGHERRRVQRLRLGVRVSRGAVPWPAGTPGGR